MCNNTELFKMIKKTLFQRNNHVKVYYKSYHFFREHLEFEPKVT